MPRLIINADDLGLTPGVNRAIIECVRGGVVTSATLMANASASAQAAAIAGELASCAPDKRKTANAYARHPGTANGPPATVSVGCHLVLVDGTPTMPTEQVCSLLANGTGEFRTTFAAFARAALARRLDPEQVRAEVESQVRRLQSYGVHVSHVDTHKHVHLFPAALRPMLQAARACGVRAVRNPFAPLKPLAVAHLVRRPHLWRRYTEVKVLRGWNQAFRRTVEAEGMVTTDGTFGIVSTGALDLELFRAVVGCIPEGTWEFCCHPGYNDSDLDKVRTRLRASRDREREVLTSAAAREILQQHGIQLISYWEIGS